LQAGASGRSDVGALTDVARPRWRGDAAFPANVGFQGFARRVSSASPGRGAFGAYRVSPILIGRWSIGCAASNKRPISRFIC
jgi:hypothetical protein